MAVVETTGFGPTVLALRALDKKMYAALLAAARAAVGPIQAEAAADSPIQTGAMAQGWQTKKMRSNGRNGYAFGYVVTNMTRQGSILEFAGSISSGHTKQGQSLIADLTATYGKPGRFGWAAYDRNRARIDADFMAAIKVAQEQTQTLLDEA